MVSSLPTGQEKPKGYESVYEDDERSQIAQDIDCVMVSQLSRSELAEIESLRSRALQPVISNLSDHYRDFTFDQEIRLWPEGKTLSDKMLFRYYQQNTLCGYALVVIGWPTSEEWAIQHLIIDPEMKLHGIGSAIVTKVEKYAYDSTAVATSMVAIPIDPAASGTFWSFLGYQDEASRKTVRLDGRNYDVIYYRKALPPQDA